MLEALYDPTVQLELFKAILSLFVALSVLAAGWLVGNNLSLRSSLRQKKRELELTALNRLYDLYGEFFAIWKLWDQKWRNPSDDDKCLPSEHQWLLLQRACAVEGQVQAFVLKLTAERTLDDDQLKLLSQFRQAFQVLRERIRKNDRLNWRSSVPSEYPEYAAFKTLTYRVACLLFDSSASLIRGSKPDPLVMLSLTSNHWENHWVDDALIEGLDQEYAQWIAGAPTVQRPDVLQASDLISDAVNELRSTSPDLPAVADTLTDAKSLANGPLQEEIRTAEEQLRLAQQAQKKQTKKTRPRKKATAKKKAAKRKTSRKRVPAKKRATKKAR